MSRKERLKSGVLIKVKTFPDSKVEEVVENSKDGFTVSVREKPERGEATRAVIRALAKYFRVQASNIRVVKGWKERNKIFEIFP
ncbi:MAG TPA: DUF167 domain-containing protein [Candidatus Paceibacterota bacterium]